MKSKKWILFSLFLMLFLLPVKAEAATVAKIGTKKYSSIRKAVSSAKSGQTIKITKNAKWTIRRLETQEIIRKKITMDLCGHTITLHSPDNITGNMNLTRSSLTIKNGTLTDGGKGTFTFQVKEKSKLILNNLKINITDSYFNAADKGSSITVKKVKMTHKAGPNAAFYLRTGATGVFSGGTFITYGNLISNYGGNVTIKGGSYSYPKSSASTSMISNGRTTDLNGKTWNGKMTVSGGTFRSDEYIIISNNIGADLKISGKALLEGTYPLMSQGTFTMTGGKIHAKTNTVTYYGRPAVDSSSAPKGCTVTLSGGTLISDGNAAVIISSSTKYKNTGAVLKPAAGYAGMIRN